jgi:hypothetical protein
MSLRNCLRGARRACRNALESVCQPGTSMVPFHEPLESRRLLSAAPTVLAVEVRGTAWTPAFTDYLAGHGLGTGGYRVPDGAAQLTDLPWSNVDQISVRFSEPVTVQTDDFYVAGATVSQYPVLAMAYNPATFTATWTLSQAISNDKLSVHVRGRVTDIDHNPLDGEWADGADAYPSGDGIAGGLFQFRVNVLPGDVDQSGSPVNAADLRAVRSSQGALREVGYSPFCDVNGDGVVNAADFDAVRAGQRNPLPTTEPGVLAVMPSSDNWYGAVLNARTDIASPFYMKDLPPQLSLITDMKAASGLTWARSVAGLQAAHPQMLIGTYHSARDAQPASTLDTYPPRAVPREGLADSQILMTLPSHPEISVVDYAQPAARRYLVDHVVQDVAASGAPLAYLDSVSHNESGFPVPWATTMTVVRDLSSELHALGKRVMINAAWVPGITSTQSVDEFLASGVDGVSLEMGFHENVRGSVARIQTAMQQYRKMLDAGKTIVFCPVITGTGAEGMADFEVEQRLHAAFGMMFRKPGDRLFNSQLFWRPTPEWATWPQQFGRPLSDAVISTNARGEIIMTRRFTNYALTMNVTTREVKYFRLAGAASATGASLAPQVRSAPAVRSTLADQVLGGAVTVLGNS